MPAYGFELVVDELRRELEILTARLEALRKRLDTEAPAPGLQAEYDRLVSKLDDKLRLFRTTLESDSNISHGA